MIQLEKKDYALIALIILFAGYIALSYFEDAQAQEEKKDYSWTVALMEERDANREEREQLDKEIAEKEQRKLELRTRALEINCKLDAGDKNATCEQGLK